MTVNVVALAVNLLINLVGEVGTEKSIKIPVFLLYDWTTAEATNNESKWTTTVSM